MAAFNSFLMTTRAQDICTFEWEGQRYSFVGCPFGIKTVPSAWQRLITKVLADCSSFVRIYIDDIVVFSATVESHIGHLTKVITLLNKFNLQVSEEKSRIGFTRCKILGQ